jgi:hypothetical protein
MMGRIVDVTRGEWQQEFGFVFDESPFGDMTVTYQFWYSTTLPRLCLEHHLEHYWAGTRDTPAYVPVVGCDECTQGDDIGVLSTGVITVHDSSDAPDRWLSIELGTIRDGCDELCDFCGYCTGPFEEDYLWLGCYGVPVTEISQIGGARVILSRQDYSFDEFLNVRTSGLFDAQGYRVTFSAANFPDDMVLDFIRSSL